METSVGHKDGRILRGPSPPKTDATRDAYAAAYAWAKPTHNLNFTYASAWPTKVLKYIYKYIRCCVGLAHAKADPNFEKKKLAWASDRRIKGRKKKQFILFSSQFTCK